jgi:hypothetical protein
MIDQIIVSHGFHVVLPSKLIPAGLACIYYRAIYEEKQFEIAPLFHM